MKTVVIALILWTVAWTNVAQAQDACEDTLAWTRTLAARVAQGRAQAEIDAAQAMTRLRRVEAELQRAIEALREAEAKIKKGMAP